MAAGIPDREVLDLPGMLLTPAFVDSHVHLAATGLAVGSADLSGARSAADLLGQVAAAARVLPHGRAVLGFGWDDTTWPSATGVAGAPPAAWNPVLPGRSELLRAAGGRPVFLGRVDVHSALVADPAAPAGTPEDAGVLWEDRPGAVTLPGILRGLVGPDQRRDLLTAALAAAAAAGIGCVHEMAAPQLAEPDDLAALAGLGLLLRPGADDRGPDPVDHDGPVLPLVAAWWGQAAADGGVATAQRLGATGCGGDLCVDGSLGSRTAALIAPYADDPANHGERVLDPAAVADHVAACARAGIRTGFHAIGDAAAVAVADGLDEAARRVGAGAVRATGCRLEHAELVPAEALARLAGHGVTAGVQPAFATTWAVPGGMYQRRLGAGRAAGIDPWAGLAAAGLALALGSDAPVTPLAGWSGVRDAVSHPVRASALGARAAFAAATRGGWRVAGRPGTGTIAVGAPAHLAAWDVPGGWADGDPDERLARWSTAPGSGVVPLPALGPDVPLPVLRSLWVGGRRSGGSGA